MRITGAFLTSRLARKIFFGVFVATSVVLLLAGMLFYQLGNHLVRSASTKVLTESGRAFGRNLFDRLTAAERLLTTLAAAESREPSVTDVVLDESSREVFATAQWLKEAEWTEPSSGTAALQPSKLEVRGSPTAGPPQLILTLAPEANHPGVRAVLQEQYIWDSAESALFNLCVQFDASAAAFCQTNDTEEGAAQVQRTVIFQPFFASPPWTLTVTASPELSQLMPVSLGLAAGTVGVLAFLVALIGTSIYLRRLTHSLDGLIRVTREASAGDFSKRVPLETLKDELKELGGSFNTMMGGLEESFSFRQVLSHIDAAILERHPLDGIVQMVLRYVRAWLPESELRLLIRRAAHTEVFSLDDNGHLQRRMRAGAPDMQGAGNVSGIRQFAVGTIDGNAAVLELDLKSVSAPTAEFEMIEKLEELGKRLVIAAEAGSHEKALSTQATTDSLTGLLNRFGFIQKLEAQLAQGRGSATDVVYCDLDRFKEVNDACGHTVGDQLLAILTARMVRTLANYSYQLARLGGDEFALLLPKQDSADVLEKIRQTLRMPVQIDTRELVVSASIGVASFPEHGTTVEELLRKSDLAMYRAKNRGGDAICRFTADLDEESVERMDLLQHLRAALDTGAIHVVYQPRVSRLNHAVMSAEALMRWKHPTLGWISPARFIPLAEETGLIESLGDWILEQTCLQFRLWQSEGIGLEQISVNVSPVQLASAGFFSKAVALLNAYEIPAGGIELEITEGALIQDLGAVAPLLRQLQEAGFHIALDDFGVGFSSLSYLSHIPFNTLKIDKSFVDEIHTNQISRAIATAIVALAKAMDKWIVAEGVELQAQAELLEQMGADELQGYFFAKPMDAATLSARARQMT